MGKEESDGKRESVSGCHLQPGGWYSSPSLWAAPPSSQGSGFQSGLPQRLPLPCLSQALPQTCCATLDNRLKSSESQMPPLWRLIFHSLWKSESTTELFNALVLDYMRRMLREGATFLQNFSEESKLLDWVIWRPPVALTDFTSLRFPKQASGGLISGLTLGNPAFTRNLGSLEVLRVQADPQSCPSSGKTGRVSLSWSVCKVGLAVSIKWVPEVLESQWKWAGN